MPTWIKDKYGNKCSVEYFGSVEAAQQALDSLAKCRNCTNCSRCSGCFDCSDCSDCSGCFDCSDCSGCSGCFDCSHCTDCFDCSRCTDCSGCSHCSRCSGCSGCFDCSDCSDCSGCFDCTNCSISGGNAPRIPIIENIDAVVLAACSVKNALNMMDWHTCDTTHCRAGWVIHLAGDAGYALEKFYGTALAAQLIYRASGSPINPARFYDDNKSAMEDMKKRVIVK